MRRRQENTDKRGVDDALLSRVEKQAWFHKYPRGWPLMLFAITSIGTAASVIAIERADRQSRIFELDRNATEIASGLQRRAFENIVLLRAGAALFASREEVSSRDFDKFASGLYSDSEDHGALGFGWARLVRTSDVPAFERAMQQDHADFRVYPQPESRQRYASPIIYLTPRDEMNRAAVGFDMYSDESRRAAMEEASRSNQPVATGPVLLIQDHGANADTTGFLIYMPVVRHEAGRDSVKGFVYSAFRAEEFLNSAAMLYGERRVEVAIYDQQREPERLLAVREVQGETGSSLDRKISIAGRDWILNVSTKRPRSLTTLGRVTLIFGTVLSLLVLLTAWLITRRAVEDRQLVEWLTRHAAVRTSLTRELNHRVKNTLANVLSIVSLTRRRATDIDDFADSLSARLRALSATHDLLSHTDWTDAPLGEIVRSELAPYMEGVDSHIEISGPEISLAPNDALSLGLALHELATNAAKYGALSAPDGRVAIVWRLLSPEIVELHWKETGGPKVAAPAKRGFGRDLIEKIVAHELRSEVHLEFKPDGVECRLKVPVRRSGEFNLRSDRGYRSTR